MPLDATSENDLEESGLRSSGERTIRMANKRKRTTTLRSPSMLRTDSEVDFDSPIAPSKEFRTNKKEKPYKFYLEVLREAA